MKPERVLNDVYKIQLQATRLHYYPEPYSRHPEPYSRHPERSEGSPGDHHY